MDPNDPGRKHSMALHGTPHLCILGGAPKPQLRVENQEYRFEADCIGSKDFCILKYANTLQVEPTHLVSCRSSHRHPQPCLRSGSDFSKFWWQKQRKTYAKPRALTFVVPVRDI